MPNSMMPAIHVLGCLDIPTEGSLRLDGIEISGLKERDLVRVRRDKIGFVFASSS
jgi:putative ABC transport system ATP-binding protein